MCDSKILSNRGSHINLCVRVCVCKGREGEGRGKGTCEREKEERGTKAFMFDKL